REFAEAACGEAGLDWRKYVETDPRYIRPTEVDHLEGDASRARSKLGWAPEVTFAELVRMMVAHDMELARQERTLRDAGHVVAARGAASVWWLRFRSGRCSRRAGSTSRGIAAS